MIRTSLLLLSILLLPATTLKAAVPENDSKPDKSIVFKKPGGNDLSLYVFLPKGWKADDKRPAAVFFFGGGWVAGKPQQFFPQAKALAEHGMVGISAQYRTRRSHETSPKECVEDGKSAVRWVRLHANELGIDPERLAIGGGSAGAHVAAATHFCTGFDAAGEDTTVSTKANALLLLNPVLDNGPSEWGYTKVKDYWQSISPAHNVKAPTPPILYMLGTKDNLIPVATAKRFEKTVKDAGGRCDLMLHEDAGHGFFNREPYKTNTIQEMIAFLKSLKWIE